MRPNFNSPRYSNLEYQEHERQYKRDVLLWEQTEALKKIANGGKEEPTYYNYSNSNIDFDNPTIYEVLGAFDLIIAVFGSIALSNVLGIKSVIFIIVLNILCGACLIKNIRISNTSKSYKQIKEELGDDKIEIKLPDKDNFEE